MTTSAKPSLYYFNVPGRGEAIRTAFRIGGIDFDDVRMNIFSYLWTYRSKSPTGRVPYLVVDGKIYTESRACLQYAAMKGGLAPVDPLQQLAVESLALYAEEIKGQVAGLFLPSWNKAKLVKAATEKITERLGKYNQMVQESLKDGFAVGGKVSMADVMIYDIMAQLKRKPFGIVVDKLDENYKALNQVHDSVAALPQLQASKQS